MSAEIKTKNEVSRGLDGIYRIDEHMTAIYDVTQLVLEKIMSV
jgi:hypothetical protein